MRFPRLVRAYPLFGWPSCRYVSHLHTELHTRASLGAFCDAMALLPSGLSIVTARSQDRRPCGLLVSSICSFSAAPPSILVSVQHGGESHSALVHAERFGVHLLRRDQEATARAFADRRALRFAAAEWAWQDDIPVIAGVIAYLRCTRVAVFDHADHAIVIGDVEQTHVEDGEPLCYMRRRMDWRLEPRR